MNLSELFADIDHFMKLVQFSFIPQCSDWIGFRVQILQKLTKINTVKREKDFKLPQRNVLWENGILETIDYAGILVFVKNRAVSEKSVTDIFHLWSRSLAILDEIIHYRTNIFNEIWHKRKQFAFAHDKHWRITNCWYGNVCQFFFKLTPWLGNKMLY